MDTENITPEDVMIPCFLYKCENDHKAIVDASRVNSRNFQNAMPCIKRDCKKEAIYCEQTTGVKEDVIFELYKPTREERLNIIADTNIKLRGYTLKFLNTGIFIIRAIKSF